MPEPDIAERIVQALHDRGLILRGMEFDAALSIVREELEKEKPGMVDVKQIGGPPWVSGRKNRG